MHLQTFWSTFTKMIRLHNVEYFIYLFVVMPTSGLGSTNIDQNYWYHIRAKITKLKIKLDSLI